MRVLEIENLNLWIQEKHLLKQISLSISEREIVGLVGESGSGKTLFTKCILGILPESANMTYDGFEVRTELGAVFQNAFTSLNPTMKIGKQLKHLYISQYGNDKRWRKKAEDLLEKVGLGANKNVLKKYPHELSGGEQQRVVIVGALLGEPKFLIADEVTTALDVETKQEIIHLFQTLRNDLGIAVLFITHDISLLQDFATKIYVMYQGELVDETHAYGKRLFQLSQNNWRRER